MSLHSFDAINNISVRMIGLGTNCCLAVFFNKLTTEKALSSVCIIDFSLFINRQLFNS